jgi:hypothetical protein
MSFFKVKHNGPSVFQWTVIVIWTLSRALLSLFLFGLAYLDGSANPPWEETLYFYTSVAGLPLVIINTLSFYIFSPLVITALRAMLLIDSILLLATALSFPFEKSYVWLIRMPAIILFMQVLIIKWEWAIKQRENRS